MSAFIIDENGKYIPVFGAIQTVELNMEAATSISADSTDAEAPTAKAVYDFVAARLQQYGTITIDV